MLSCVRVCAFVCVCVRVCVCNSALRAYASTFTHYPMASAYQLFVVRYVSVRHIISVCVSHHHVPDVRGPADDCCPRYLEASDDEKGKVGEMRSWC